MFKRRHEWNNDPEGAKKHRSSEFIPYQRPDISSNLPTKVPITRTGRSYTVSIAIPGSILNNCHTLKLKTQVVGAIARAAAIFNVDEIVVYDEYCSGKVGANLNYGDNHDAVRFDGGQYMDAAGGGDANVKCVYLMAKILEYLECPQYLRKNLFPLHSDLQFAGLLNPLASTHHLTDQDMDIPYREGVVTSKFRNNSSLVYVGLHSEVVVDRSLQENVRVTVEMDANELKLLTIKNETSANSWNSGKYQKYQKPKPLNGKIVSPSEPRTKCGLYWGYSVRVASSLFDTIDTCPYKDTNRYDLVIGTSENGQSVDDVGPKLAAINFNHCLIVFGGVKGLESVFESDTKSQSKVDSVDELFNYYINVCPNQGSNTIRTEEAILVAMSAFRPHLLRHMKS